MCVHRATFQSCCDLWPRSTQHLANQAHAKNNYYVKLAEESHEEIKTPVTSPDRVYDSGILKNSAELDFGHKCEADLIESVVDRVEQKIFTVMGALK